MVKSNETDNQKERKITRLAEALLQIVSQTGIEGVTLSKLARSAGVSRAWIYKYGGSLEDLLAFGVDHFGRIFTSLDESPRAFSTSQQWIEGTVESFGRLLDNAAAKPMAVLLYFRFKGTQTLIGKRIARIERLQADREIGELRRLFRLSKRQAEQASEIIGCVRMGLAHGWAFGDLKGLASADEAKRRFREAIRAVLAAGD